MNLVAVLAGGVGARMGITIPKQFLEFAGRTVLEHSVQAFENHPAVDKILIVMNSDYVDEAKAIIQRNNWPKVCGVIIGGNNRYDSSAAAIDYFLGNSPADKILIHDAARPLVSNELITRVLNALDKYDAVNVGVTPSNTIVSINSKNEITSTPDRAKLIECQTPQGFRLGVVSRAYEMAMQQADFAATDDCGVIAKMLPEVKIFVAEGDEKNQKLTTPEDLPVFEYFFKRR